MKTTPGPWKVAGQGDGNQQLPILANGKIIAAVRDHGRLDDARLIAAAPELLKSLKKVLRQAEEMLCDEMKTDDLAEWPWVANARAAIRQAEGVTP